MVGRKYIHIALVGATLSAGSIRCLENIDPSMLEFGKGIVEFAGERLKEFNKDNKKAAKDKAEEIVNERKVEEEIIAKSKNYSKERVELAKKRIAELDARKKQVEDDDRGDRNRIKNTLHGLTEQVFKGALDEAHSIREHGRERQNFVAKAKIDAQEKTKADAEKWKQFYTFIEKDPGKKVLFVLGCSVAVSGGYYGTKNGINIVTDMYKKPQLADPEKTTLKFGLLNTVKSWIYGDSKDDSSISDVILEPELAERINETVTTIKNTRKNGGFLKNIMFYGPPGTGKTMIAMRIARSCDCDFIAFAASALDKLNLEDGTNALTEIIRYAKGRSRPMILFIDEAEILLGNRNNPNVSEKTKKWANLLLEATGTESSDLMLMFATNMPETIDKAVLSRCDDRIHIPAPAPKERLAILKLYVDKWLKKCSNLVARKPAFLSFDYFFGTPEQPKVLSIEDGILSDEALNKISERIQGFVGRDISKMVIQIQQSGLAQEDGRITKAIVDRVVKTKIAQVADEAQGFKMKLAQSAAETNKGSKGDSTAAA